MTIRLILVGEAGPAERLLKNCRNIPGLVWLRWYVDTPPSFETDALVSKLKVQRRPSTEINSPAGHADLKLLRPHWIVNINSTTVLDNHVLTTPLCGTLNAHPGPLPEYAGLHAPQWAIRNGESVFGVTVHWMERRIDAGEIAYSQVVPILPTDTGLTLTLKCQTASVDLMLFAIGEISAGRLPPKIPQNLSKRRVYRHQEALNGKIDWNWSAKQVCDFVRAANYEPLTSPTYVPESEIEGARVIVKVATPIAAARDGLKPGNVIESSATSATVICGDGIAIKIGFVRSGKN